MLVVIFCVHFVYIFCFSLPSDIINNESLRQKTGVSEVSRKNKKGGVIIPDDNIT